MKYAIVISKVDKAGMNIHEKLLKFGYQGKIYLIDEESIFSEVNHLDEDIIIFATKHASEKGVPSLTLHFPGNWGKAEAGGEDKTLSVAAASLQKELFIELNMLAKNLKHRVVLEATHHGPTVDKPCVFIEIGSTLDDWKDDESGKIIARTIIKTLSKRRKEYETFFAIGGMHYASEFSKIVLNTRYALGHICPKYAAKDLDLEMIKQALKKSGAEKILLDWKGIGPEKNRIIKILEDNDIKYKKLKEIKKV